ncbi:uncharacterized protein LOC126893967 [Daktulosphaira vitifoliae]|uniref:uncharacterized protein LOC126893967 n=1 Tax=Daktulosphaira vitifoliae TaxID=58002 RepID=UPI0021AAD614|nr:uncharacterized protein LOC126893967 [Daktulosphaira vitifoliae]XP_050520508.1 uncharacterized protein LOC126893967 [Daktulosphaira vitifoliae]
MYKITESENLLTVNKIIDLRSDTVTRPDIKMRQAMFEAEVGDDGYGEDPTVNRLENRAAQLFQKEAAIFLPSGLMGNLVSMIVHSKHRGSEVIVGSKSHILLWEQGGASQIGSLQLREVKNLPDGTFDILDLNEKLRPESPDPHEPYTSVVCIENTHNTCGGTVLPLKWIDELSNKLKKEKIPLHMDGARVFNAAVSLGVPVSRIVRDCDSVTFCLSKGLGSPIGAVLVGSKSFIQQARRTRKVLGGAMRQAGVIAAAGLYALENCVERLADDHRRAKSIACAIQEIASPNFTCNLNLVQSNMLIININVSKVNVSDFIQKLLLIDKNELLDSNLNKTHSTIVKVSQLSSDSVRIVLHKDISEQDVNIAIEKLKYVISRF